MSWQAERARVASFTRSRTPDDPDLVEARRNLRAERLAEHVARVVADWPPLTDEQCRRIAQLLMAGANPSTDRQAAVADRIAELDGGGDHAA